MHKILLLMMAVVLAGCNSTPKLWEERIGTFSLNEAKAQYGDYTIELTIEDSNVQYTWVLKRQMEDSEGKLSGWAQITTLNLVFNKNGKLVRWLRSPDGPVIIPMYINEKTKSSADLDLEKKVLGTYEIKTKKSGYKFVLLKNAFAERYFNGDILENEMWSWEVLNGELYINRLGVGPRYSQISRINPDKSVTAFAEIINGKRKNRTESEWVTSKKVE